MTARKLAARVVVLGPRVEERRDNNFIQQEPEGKACVTARRLCLVTRALELEVQLAETKGQEMRVTKVENWVTSDGHGSAITYMICCYLEPRGREGGEAGNEGRHDVDMCTRPGGH